MNPKRQVIEQAIRDLEENIKTMKLIYHEYLKKRKSTPPDQLEVFHEAMKETFYERENIANRLFHDWPRVNPNSAYYDPNPTPVFYSADFYGANSLQNLKPRTYPIIVGAATQSVERAIQAIRRTEKFIEQLRTKLKKRKDLQEGLSMKLTEEKLKQLIVEVMSEHLTKVDPPEGIPPEFLDKIHSLLDAGEINQAQSLIDGLGGDPNYARNYIEYPEVGDMEKLGNEANAARSYSKIYSGLPPDIDAKAAAAAKEKALRASGGFDPPPLSPHGGPMDDRTKDFFDAMTSANDRFMKNAARGKISRISKRPLVDPKDFLE